MDWDRLGSPRRHTITQLLRVVLMPSRTPDTNKITSLAIRPDLRLRDAGFGLIEILVMAVVVVVAASGSVLILNSAGRMTISHRQQIAMSENIESYLAQAAALGDSYTCCAGSCSTTPPGTTVDGGASTSSCATANPRDDRYFFPIQDNPATTTALFGLNTCTVGGLINQACSREPDAVTEVCKLANVALLLGPLKTDVDRLTPPTGTRRETEIQTTSKTLRITITEEVNGRTARVFDLYPPMSRFCP